MRRVVLALLAALIPCRPAAAITGASAPAPDLEPSVVMLLNRMGGTAGFCSAIVVAPDVLLTAAHCALPGADLMGFEKTGASPAMHGVRDVRRSPGFRADAVRSRQRSIDLALVRLAEPLPARFHPIPLADLPAHGPGAAFRLAGFGLRQEGAPASSGSLRAARVLARAPSSDVLLWAKGEGADASGACTGDSGGPVLAGDAVVAVIAWAAGEGGRQCGALTQAVWIAPQRGWIDGVLDEWRRR